MEIDPEGWLQEVCHRQSPHYDERPFGQTPELLVLHNISLPPGCFGGDDIDALFLGTLDCSRHPFYQQLIGLRVSAHCLIRRDGALIQYVSFLKRAWHAGLSSFQGRHRCNDYGIGVELEGSDDSTFTSSQYQTLHLLTLSLMRHYPQITLGRIVGHSDIAPGRKTDPGPEFNWPAFRASLMDVTA